MSLPKTVKVSYEAYKLIERMAQQTGESMTDTATALVAGNLAEFKGGMDKLTEAVEEIESLRAPSGHESPSLVTSPGSAKRQLAKHSEENDESEEDTAGLASPFDEDEDGGDRGRWIALGTLAFILLIGLGRVGAQRQVYSNRGVM